MRACWLTAGFCCAAAWDAGNEEVALDTVAKGEKKEQIWRVTDCKKAGVLDAFSGVRYTGCRFYNGHSYLAVNLESDLYLRRHPGGNLVLKSHAADDDPSKPPEWAMSQRWDLLGGSDDGRYRIRSVLLGDQFLAADGRGSGVTLERSAGEWRLAVQGAPTRVVDARSSRALSRPPGVVMQARGKRRSQLWIWDGQGDASSVKLQNVETRLFLDADTFSAGTVTAWKENRQDIAMNNQRWLFGGRLWWWPLQLYPMTVRLANGLFTDRCLAVHVRQVEVHPCKNSSNQLWDVEVMLERHTGGRRIVRLVNVDTSDVLAADVEPGPGEAGWTDLAAAKAALTAMLGVLATCAWHLLRRTTCPGLGPGPRCPGPTGPPDRLCEGPPAARLDGLPEGLPESRPEGLPDDGPEGRPEGLPEGRPEGLPDDRADGRPHDGPDDRPDGRAEGPPDDRPDGLPEGLPEGRLESLTDDRPGGRLGDGADDRPDGRPEEPPDDRPVGPPQKPGHVFFSLRFKEAMAAAQVLKKRLEELGYSVFLCDALAGEDIFRNLICKNLESADFAVIFGTETYGQKTHEVMSTFQELLWILNHAGEADKYSRLQKVAVLKMCERYKEVCTQMALHKALSYIEWDGSETAAQKVCGKIHRAFSSTGSIGADSSSGS